jgi:hypothetical protein
MILLNMQANNNENLILANVETAIPTEVLVHISHCRLAVMFVTTNSNNFYKTTQLGQNSGRAASLRSLYVRGWRKMSVGSPDMQPFLHQVERL